MLEASVIRKVKVLHIKEHIRVGIIEEGFATESKQAIPSMGL